ncbi:MAG: ribose 5-phosphate isomerase B [Anaerolineales bacterium]
MRVMIASDHEAYHLKQAVIDHLRARGVEPVDAGADGPDVPVDYPDYAQVVGYAVTSGHCDRGIVICGTGLGISMAANKVPGIRAAVCHDVFAAHQARAHNDSNVLAMGAWVITPERAMVIVDEWLDTAFEGGRHRQRLAKLEVGAHAGSHMKGSSAPPRLRLGVALSPNSTSFGPLLFSGRLIEGLRAAAEDGFEAVELSLRTAEDIEPGQLTEELERYRLSLVAIATGQSCIEDGLCLCSADPHTRRLAVERVKSFVPLAANAGAAVIIGGIRGRLTGSEAQQAKARAAAVEAIRECAAYAVEHRVALLIEAINRYESNFINTTAEGLALVEEISLPSVRLLLDTFHMNIEDPDICEALRIAGDRIGYIHLADSNREAPGRGHVEFPQVFQTLAEIDYTGFVTVEILPLPDDATAMKQAGSYLATLLAGEPAAA